jgi:hypothetical protein
MQRDPRPTQPFIGIASRIVWIIAAFTIVFSLLIMSVLAARPTVVYSLAETLSPTGPVPLPAIDTADSVEALRALHQVRPVPPYPTPEDPRITPGYEDIMRRQNIFALPYGVYGFTVPWLLNTDPTGVVGGTGVSRISLSPTSGGTGVMEMHKGIRGVIYVVGYTTREDVQRLLTTTGDTYECILFTTPAENYIVPVAIPVVRLVHSHFRSLDRIYVLDLAVAVGPSWRIKTPVPAVPIVLPKPGQNSILLANSLEDLRNYNGVHEIHWLDEDRDLNQLPDGIYGYTVPWMLNSDPSNVVGGTGINKISLIREPGGTRVMEVHRTAKGQIYVVGYMSDAEIGRLNSAVPGSAFSTMLFMSPLHDFTRLVGVPAERILY